MVATGEDERSERLLGESSPELGTCLVAREDEHRCEKAKELRSSPKLHSSVARALQRPRLLRALGRLDGRKLGLVIAPAGWGKTILLGQYAAAHDGPVAWCASHGAPETFEARVCAVVAEMTNQTGVGGVVEDLSAALATCSGQSALVVIDDVHLISGTTAERVLEKLIAHSPPGVVVLAAGRSRPALDLSLLRVQDEVVEVGPEELRFRVWEVERLFSEVYGEALLPEASAQLARRTEGWPACLQLFHLATSGMSPSRRALVLENLPAWRARLVKGYLTRHILEELPQDIRAFLIRTSVLPRPTGPLCDMLLGRTGSEQVLEELERRQLFTQRIDQAGVFCYHEVLRSYLEAELHSLVGERGLCSHYREAGDLLASEGRMEEALWCYARAGEEDLVAKLAATSGRVLPGVESPWMEVLPAGGLSSDPWLCLGRARQALGQGRLEEALKAYRDGTLAGEEGSLGNTCLREQRTLASWVRPTPGMIQLGGGWPAVIRQAISEDPAAAVARARGMPGATGRFAEGCATMMHGEWRSAARQLWAVAELPDASTLVATAARLVASVCEIGLGLEPTVDLETLAEEAALTEVPWLERVAHGILSLGRRDGFSQLEALELSCVRGKDPWGAAIAAFLGGLHCWRWSRRDLGSLERAVGAFRDLEAQVLAAWAAALAVIVSIGAGTPARGDARERDIAVESSIQTRHTSSETVSNLVDLARSIAKACRAGGPLAVVEQAMASKASGMEASGHHSVGSASSVFPVLAGGYGRTGHLGPVIQSYAPPSLGAGSHEVCLPDQQRQVPLALQPGPVHSDHRPPDAGSWPSRSRPAKKMGTWVKCFGGFGIEVGGRDVALDWMKPRARQLLRLLAAQAGRAVHREVLVESLWPSRGFDAGLRSLQVAVSQIRTGFSTLLGIQGFPVVARQEGAYALVLPEESAIDVALFDAARQQVRDAQASGDVAAALAAFDEVRALYIGDLLPEEGPAEWVVYLRHQYQVQASALAGLVARLCLLRDQPREAIRACRWGLRVERLDDELWQLLGNALRAAGAPAAAARAKAEYEALLAGLEQPTAPGWAG